MSERIGIDPRDRIRTSHVALVGHDDVVIRVDLPVDSSTAKLEASAIDGVDERVPKSVVRNFLHHRLDPLCFLGSVAGTISKHLKRFGQSVHLQLVHLQHRLDFLSLNFGRVGVSSLLGTKHVATDDTAQDN